MVLCDGICIDCNGAAPVEPPQPPQQTMASVPLFRFGLPDDIEPAADDMYSSPRNTEDPFGFADMFASLQIPMDVDLEAARARNS